MTKDAQAAQNAQTAIGGDQMGNNFQAPTVDRNSQRRVMMVPMLDGVKLYTVIFVPKGARGTDRTDADALKRRHARAQSDGGTREDAGR